MIYKSEDIDLLIQKSQDTIIKQGEEELQIRGLSRALASCSIIDNSENNELVPNLTHFHKYLYIKDRIYIFNDDSLLKIKGIEQQ